MTTGARRTTLIYIRVLDYTIYTPNYKIKAYPQSLTITDALSTILQLLGEELEEASQLIEARSRIEPVKLYNEEW